MWIFIWLLLVSNFFQLSVIAAEELPLGFEADGMLEYVEGGDVIIGKKNVRITYGDVHLKAEEVRVDIKKGKVLARGDTVLTMGGNVFKGSEIEYNFRDGTGKILKVSTVEGPWHIKGDVIEKVGEREYWAYNTRITSCELPEPHYYFSSKRIKLYPHERIWVKDAVLWIRDIPVFYLPVYTRSLKGKPYGLVVSPGYDSKKGFFILSHYNWFINTDLEGRIYFDPIERLGLGRGFDIRYGIKGVPLGYFYAYQIRENNLRYDSGEGKYYHPQDAGKTNRWKIHARHWQHITAKDNIFFEINKFSDENFNEDFFLEEKWRGWKEEKLKDYDQQNVIELSHREKGYTLTLSARRRLNRFFSIKERLPEINFDLRRREIRPHVYFDFDGSYVYLRQRPGDAEVHRSDVRFELSRPYRLFGWLNFTPTVVSRITWYDRGRIENRNFWRHYYGTSIGMDTRLYKIEYLEKGNIEKKRHIIEPRLYYFYYPDVNVNQNRLFNFDSLDRLDSDNRFNFQLINRLQGKKINGETVEWLRAISEINYDLKTSTKFKDLRQEILFRPDENISTALEAQYNFEKNEIEMLNFDSEWRKGPWQVSVGTTYYLTEHKRSNLDIEEEIIWNFSPLWRFSLSNRYDLTERNLEWSEFTVYRDLHCWEAQFIVQKRQKKFEDRDELRFYLAFNIKALPNKIFGISKTTTLDRRIRR